MQNKQTTEPKKAKVSFNFTEQLDGFDVHLRSGKIVSWDAWRDAGTDIRVRTFKDDIIVEQLFANNTKTHNFPMETVDYYTKVVWQDNSSLY